MTISPSSLIVGSTGGIGLQIAKELHERNYHLITTSLSKHSTLVGQPKDCHFLIDCRDLTQVRNSFEVMSNLGIEFTSLVCTVGSGSIRLSEPISQWKENISLNLLSVTNVVEEAVRFFSKSMNNIVVISSIAGVTASLDPPIEYSTSKAALNHYIRVKAKEIAKTGICINAIAPGNLIYANSRWQERLDENQEIVLRYIAENVPLNRFGQPKDVSSLIVQILENNTFMTGQIIAIDGGQTL